MLVWGTYNYSYRYLASFPSSCSVYIYIYIHNYDTMIIQVLTLIYYMYTCIDKTMQIVLEQGSIDT